MPEQQNSTSVRVSNSGIDLNSIANKPVPLPKSGVDVAGLIRSTQAVDAQNAQGTDALMQIFAQAAAESNAAADREGKIGQNNAIIKSTELTAKLETQKATLKAAADLGTNYSDQANLMTGLVRDRQKAYDDMNTSREIVHKKQTSSFLDNPLGWLMDQFTVNDDIANYNDAATRYDLATENFMAANAMTQTAAATQAALTPSITQATIQAAADNAALESQNKALTYKLEGAKYNAQGIQAAMNLSKDQLDHKYAVFNAARAQEQTQIALAHLALQRTEFIERQEDRRRKIEADSDTLKKINVGIVNRGGTPIPENSAEAYKVIELAKSNSPLGKQYQSDYFSGEASMMHGTKIVAPTPADFADMVYNRVPVNMPGSEKVQQLIISAAEDAKKEAVATGEKDINKIKSRTNELVQEKLKSFAANIRPEDEKNPFNIPNMKILAGLPATKDLPVVKNLIKPALDSGADLSNPSKMMAFIAQAVRDKKLSYQDAIAASTLYSQGVETNKATRQFTALGVPPPSSYNVQLQENTNSLFSTTVKADLTKPDSFGRALQRYMTLQADPRLNNPFATY